MMTQASGGKRRLSIVEIGTLNLNPEGEYMVEDIDATAAEAEKIVGDSKWRTRKPKFTSVVEESDSDFGVV